MQIHFIGIGGTLMGHLALLAKQAGHQVSGSDQGIYPPMSDILSKHQISVYEQTDLARLKPRPDLFVLGNAGLGRGHPAVEHLLREDLPFVSGAQWLSEFVLAGRWTMAVAGTHGKTTTTAMLAWILEQAGFNPGFMIGGVPANFGASARLSPESEFFVVEADEYDTSYFDRQAKFLHYRPRTLIISNLEYDHADIYPDLSAIGQQFHLLLRTVPDNGLVVVPADDASVEEVLAKGLWTPTARFSTQASQTNNPSPLWQGHTTAEGFELYLDQEPLGTVHWSLQGQHNTANAIAAIAAAHHAGVQPQTAIEALSSFQGVKRRLEKVGQWGALILYDDFAHHPTAIATTLQGLRARHPNDRIIALIEPSSHTMKRGDLADRFAHCTEAADLAIWHKNPELQWSVEALVATAPERIESNDDLDTLAIRATQWVKEDRTVHAVCMSNHAFDGLIEQISERCRKLLES